MAIQWIKYMAYGECSFPNCALLEDVLNIKCSEAQHWKDYTVWNASLTACPSITLLK